MRTRTSLASAGVALALLGAPSPAQSVYVDFGEGSPPSPTYGAAAGVGGHWNQVAMAWDPPPFAPLLGLDQQATGVTFRAFHCDNGAADFPATSGDDGSLLDDWYYGDCSLEPATVQVAGLQAGTYQMFVYAKGDGGGPVSLFLDPSAGASVEGGDLVAFPSQPAFPGVYAGWEIGVRLLHVPQDGGFLSMEIGAEVGQGISGMQLLQLDDATPFCSGDLGHCPCGVGAPLSGCPSSFNPSGALMSGHGTRQVSNDTMKLTAVGVLDSGLCLFFQGTTAQNLGLGTPFGDGLRCAGGPLKRIGAKSAINGVARYPGQTDTPISVRGAVPPSGGFRTYQVRYRNAAPYCTSDTFNTTNGVAIEWLP